MFVCPKYDFLATIQLPFELCGLSLFSSMFVRNLKRRGKRLLFCAGFDPSYKRFYLPEKERRIWKLVLQLVIIGS